MYSREQAFQMKQSFWTAFGQYMAPVPSSEGLKVNWVNYKTGLKDVFFRLKADNKKASIGIDIAHSDLGLQELFFQQFLELKNLLHGYLNEEWNWELHTNDVSGKVVSRISKDLCGVSVFNEHDWHQMITFFKLRMIALDEFRTDAKYTFDALK